MAGAPSRRRPATPAFRSRSGAAPHRRAFSGRRALLALWLGLLAGGMALAALRVDGIRVRYALAEAVSEEATLRAERAELVVAVRRLRDPARLSALARDRGMARPERVIELGATEARP